MSNQRYPEKTLSSTTEEGTLTFIPLVSFPSLEKLLDVSPFPKSYVPEHITS